MYTAVRSDIMMWVYGFLVHEKANQFLKESSQQRINPNGFGEPTAFIVVFPVGQTRHLQEVPQHFPLMFMVHTG